MKKKETLFQKMLQLLIEDIIPSIIINLKNLGMEYSHIKIPAEASLCFFKYINRTFPFNINDLDRITTEKGENQFLVLLSIKYNGEVSISERIIIENDGIMRIQNKIVICEDFIKLFRNTMFENQYLYFISKELTSGAKSLENDFEIVNVLLSEMANIKPKITRYVLTEKK